MFAILNLFCIILLTPQIRHYLLFFYIIDACLEPSRYPSSLFHKYSAVSHGPLVYSSLLIPVLMHGSRLYMWPDPEKSGNIFCYELDSAPASTCHLSALHCCSCRVYRQPAPFWVCIYIFFHKNFCLLYFISVDLSGCLHIYSCKNL